MGTLTQSAPGVSPALQSALAEADTVVVGLSGGADSVFLLTRLVTLLGAGHVAAAHLNHMIRGAEADRDESFCRTLCERLGVPLFCRREDVPGAAAASGESLETAARRARYAFFEETRKTLLDAGQTNVLVATAHNADDNLETMLFHLLRGSGTHGLSGIPERRDFYVRPLLALSGNTIRETLRGEGTAFVEDSTNGDAAYTRNFLRTRLVPLLREVTPSPEDAALRCAALCREDDECLTALAREALGDGLEKGVAAASDVRLAHPAIGSRMLLLLHHRVRPDGPYLEKCHLDAILEVLRRGDGPAEVSLPGAVRFRVSGGVCTFLLPENGAPEPFSVTLPLGASVRTPRHTVFFGPEGNAAQNIYKFAIHTTAKFDTITKQLSVRSYRPGDTYRLGGMTRLVKKMLSEKKLSPEERLSLPLFCLGDTVVWVPGYPPADGFRDGGVPMILAVSGLPDTE